MYYTATVTDNEQPKHTIDSRPVSVYLIGMLMQLVRLKSNTMYLSGFWQPVTEEIWLIFSLP